MPYKHAEPRRFFLAVIGNQLSVGVQNVRAKNFPVNIDVDLYTLSLKQCVFATHCAVDSLDVCNPHRRSCSRYF